jgi:hypothetical protein
LLVGGCAGLSNPVFPCRPISRSIFRRQELATGKSPAPADRNVDVTAWRGANILVCGFTELSSSVFLMPVVLGGALEKEPAPINLPHGFARGEGTGNWKVASTRRQERRRHGADGSGGKPPTSTAAIGDWPLAIAHGMARFAHTSAILTQLLDR